MVDGFRLDMAMMFAIHDALRRDLDEVTPMTIPQFLPWLLAGTDAKHTNAILGRLPEPVQRTYRNEWQPAYAAQDWWAAT